MLCYCMHWQQMCSVKGLKCHRPVWEDGCDYNCRKFAKLPAVPRVPIPSFRAATLPATAANPGFQLLVRQLWRRCPATVPWLQCCNPAAIELRFQRLQRRPAFAMWWCSRHCCGFLTASFQKVCGRLHGSHSRCLACPLQEALVPLLTVARLKPPHTSSREAELCRSAVSKDAAEPCCLVQKPRRQNHAHGAPAGKESTVSCSQRDR